MMGVIIAAQKSNQKWQYTIYLNFWKHFSILKATLKDTSYLGIS